MAVPEDLPEDDMATKSLFESCVGQIFPIVGFHDHLLELEVGGIRGKEPCMDSIWIEPQYVELISETDR